MEDIFSRLNSITNSDEYKKYKEIGKILESDTSIKILQDEIENLQKEALILEYKIFSYRKRNSKESRYTK